MITVRYKQNRNNMFSVYFDIYYKNADGVSIRKYDYTRIYVSQDYSKIKRIKDVDKEKMELVNSIKAQRELELIQTINNCDVIVVKKIDLSFTTSFLKLPKTEIQTARTISL